jgi:hypothetical protein
MKLRVRRDAQKGHVVDGKLYGPGEELPGDYAEVPAGLGWKLEPGDEVKAPARDLEEPSPAHALNPPGWPKEPLDAATPVREAPAVEGAHVPAIGPTAGRAREGQRAGPVATPDDDRPEWYNALRDRLGTEPTRDDLVSYGDSRGIDVRGLRKDEMIARIAEHGEAGG